MNDNLIIIFIGIILFLFAISIFVGCIKNDLNHEKKLKDAGSKKREEQFKYEPIPRNDPSKLVCDKDPYTFCNSAIVMGGSPFGSFTSTGTCDLMNTNVFNRDHHRSNNNSSRSFHRGLGYSMDSHVMFNDPNNNDNCSDSNDYSSDNDCSDSSGDY